jgi:hypothetical protein
MACKGCGAGDFAEKLGTCGFCIGLAASSAAVFWLLYALSRDWPRVSAISWLLLTFASLVSLAFLSRRSR